MAIEIFLKIDGIDGESTDKAHESWIEVLSYSHGVSQPTLDVGGGGAHTGERAEFEHFSLIKNVDRATADLNVYCASGTYIPRIEMELVLATGDRPTFMRYTLEQCLVSLVRVNGTRAEGSGPTEEVAFGYGTIRWEYTPIDQTGNQGPTIERIWNLETNQQE